MTALPPQLLTLAQRLAGLSPEERAQAIAKIPPSQQQAILAAITDVPLIAAQIGATGKLTPKQQEAEALFSGDHRHVFLVGGSRSGKTWLIIKKLVERALTAPCSQAILRYRFNALHASIIEGTFPRVMAAHFPAADWKLDKQLWHVKFGNGSVIWYSGLDEAERVEKVLGQGHSGIFLNECSQIPWGSREVAVTRLAEKVPGVPQLMVCDANPPSKSHWTYKLFISKVDPSRNEPLVNPDAYVWLRMNPRDNEAHLDAAYFDDLNSLDERRRKRFLLGEFTDDTEDALWTLEILDEGRILGREPPQMQRIVVAVDPSGCKGPEDLRSDEIGIVVCGCGVDGRGYVLADRSGRMAPSQWAQRIAEVYEEFNADCVVAETNFGGPLIEEVIKTASVGGLPLSFKAVTASRGKHVRAEPVAALWTHGQACLVGRHKHLEDQMCSMTTAGWRGDRSPDRLDAMVWGMHALFPKITRETRGLEAGEKPAGLRPSRSSMNSTSMNPARPRWRHGQKRGSAPGNGGYPRVSGEGEMG